jgi:aerobic carbon-monoxide dehydrogenase medium subunit
MLLNLNTIFKPTTVEEAAALLSRPGAYPLYGGAALQRRADPNVTTGIDLSALKLDYVRDSENSLRLGSMLTLEQVRQACAARGAEHPKLAGLANMLAAEMPETLRNTYTLGDLLVERDPRSLTMALFLALGVILKRVDIDMHFTAGAWLGMVNTDVSRYLIAHLRVTRGPRRAAVAFEKVARTPADTPIVGAVVYTALCDDGRTSFTTLALCGAAPTPIRQPEVIRVLTETGDMERALDSLELDPPDDYLGSREYRDEMARVVSRRALERALEMVK